MSNKYSWSHMYGGTIHASTNDGDEYLARHEIAERMNKMQDVVNAAKKYAESDFESNDAEQDALLDAVEKLNPPTEQELDDEVVRAAIAWDTNPSVNNEQALKKASSAWLKFKSAQS